MSYIYIFYFYLESLTIAQAKAKKAMYISDLDEDDVNPKTKKLKPSINCPVFQVNIIIIYI